MGKRKRKIGKSRDVMKQGPERGDLFITCEHLALKSTLLFYSSAYFHRYTHEAPLLLDEDTRCCYGKPKWAVRCRQCKDAPLPDGTTTLTEVLSWDGPPPVFIPTTMRSVISTREFQRGDLIAHCYCYDGKAAPVDEPLACWARTHLSYVNTRLYNSYVVQWVVLCENHALTMTSHDGFTEEALYDEEAFKGLVTTSNDFLYSVCSDHWIWDGCDFVRE